MLIEKDKINLSTSVAKLIAMQAKRAVFVNTGTAVSSKLLWLHEDAEMCSNLADRYEISVSYIRSDDGSQYATEVFAKKDQFESSVEVFKCKDVHEAKRLAILQALKNSRSNVFLQEEKVA